MRASADRTRTRRFAGPRISVVLLLVAIVPLIGMAVPTWQQISEARAARTSAVRSDHLARDTVGLIELNSALLDEMVWASIVRVASSLEASPELLAEFLDSDPVRGFADAQTRTDELVRRTGRTDVAAALRTARSGSDDLAGLLARYRDAKSLVTTPLRASIDELVSTTSSGVRGDAVPRAAAMLGHAVDVRNAIGDEFYEFFATVFDLRDSPRVELGRLIQARSTWESGLAALASTDELRAPVERLRADPQIITFNDAIDRQIGTSLGADLPAKGQPVTLAGILPNLDSFVTIYESATHTSVATAELLRTASDGMLDAATDAQAEADGVIRRAYSLAALLSAASLLVALSAARFIVRPLRELRRAAVALQHPDEKVSVAIAGPVEVRAAASALADASHDLDLVTEQVLALSAGALDAEALDRPVSGGLGIAVQSAVGTLRSALAQQDEFRRRLAHEASHDGLTQLANRNASMAQLTRSLARTTRSGAKLAVLFIDLDHFKDVNDHHGHQAGDGVLTTIAQRLVNGVREGDHVGRLGGDEFLVVAEPVQDVEEAVALAERLLDQLNAPIALGASSIVVGASIGIAVADGSDLTADELLRDADLAVYRAKDQGRGAIDICDEDLRTQMAEHADLSLAIRQAIDHDELVLHYQPIVDTRTNSLHAFEALVRWQRPGHDDLIPPDKFIGFAERSNLIIDLDRWVIDAVASQLAEWGSRAAFVDVPVALNISPRHLGSAHFIDDVLEPLHRHGVDPRSIIVEITENALLDDLAGAAIKLQRLREEGIQISIDDFGTGYTSLAHLRSLPVDILKIDRSFTTRTSVDPHEASMVKLIIDTGHLLGATITAEGVETEREVDTLTALGSDNLQGFYFARPQSPDQLEGLAESLGAVAPGLGLDR